jgi:hypothetical protein
VRLRIAPITWHKKYQYTIGGLRVNGKRRRMFFETRRDAEDALRQLQIKVRRQGEEGLNIPDTLRVMAAEGGSRTRPVWQDDR